MVPSTAFTSLGFTPALRTSTTADPSGTPCGASSSMTRSAALSASGPAAFASTLRAALRWLARAGVELFMTKSPDVKRNSGGALRQAEQISRLGRAGDLRAERLDDPANLGDHRRIARRQHPAREIDAVLDAGADMPAGEVALRGCGECVPANADGGEGSAGRQQAARVEYRLRRRLEAVAHAEDEGAERRRIQGAVGDQIVQQGDVAGIEQFDLRLHSGFANDAGHTAYVFRGVDDDLAAGVHRVEVQRADIGPQRRDMLDPRLRPDEGGARAGDGGVVHRRREASARPGRKVQDQLRVARADALDDLAVERKLH